jgi:hypothetical protein
MFTKVHCGGYSCRVVEKTTHPHLAPRLRMNTANLWPVPLIVTQYTGCFRRNLLYVQRAFFMLNHIQPTIPISELNSEAYNDDIRFKNCELLHIYCLPNTYLLTPWCRVLLEKLTGLQLVKKFPAFHGTPRFITALTSVRHLSLSWASPIQSIYPHPTSWRSIQILSTHLRLGQPIGLHPSGFPTKTL